MVHVRNIVSVSQSVSQMDIVLYNGVVTTVLIAARTIRRTDTELG